MTENRERYLETALDELYHGGPSEDLVTRILSREVQAPLETAKHKPRPRTWLWLQAAGVLLAIGLVALVVLPRQANPLPDGVAASGGTYEFSRGRLEINQGWYALTGGAPVVSRENTQIEQVTGRVLVKVGEVPDETELQAQKDWLRRNGMENAMNFKWIQAGGLAICVLAGTAVVDGSLIEAQKVEAQDDAAKKKDWSAFEKDIKADKARLEEVEGEMRDLNAKIESADKDIKAAEKGGTPEQIKKLKDTRAQHQADYDKLEDEYYKLARGTNIREYELKIHNQEEALAELTEALKRNPNDRDAKLEVTEAQRELDELKLALKTYKEEADAAPNGFRTDPDAPITVDFMQKGIHEAMHYIALRTGLQLAIEGELDTKITIKMENAKPRDVLRAICTANGLVMIEDGDVIILKKAAGESSTPDRNADPETPISVNYQDMLLSDVLMDIAKRSGLDIQNELPAGEDTAVTLSLSKIKPRQIVELICDDCELRLLKRGETLIVRQALGDMTQEALKDELENTTSERDALKNRLQFLEVAIEAAKEEGDKEAIADYQKKKDALLNLRAELESEIEALNDAING
ncbi:MAG: hypothetical protein H6839_04275 [Planctomycetes bacterium]|nr:hypothetical protein [Planctomycetota bacterium]